MKINFSEIHTKSNYLSLFRLFLAVPIYYFLGLIPYGEKFRYIVFALWFLAFLTDIGDGYLARKYNEVTEMGKIIDPLADKVVVAVIIIKLYMEGMIPDVYFFIIILRDVIIFLGGIYVSRRVGKVLPSNKLGKMAVFSIMLFLIAVLFNFKVTVTWLYNFFYYLSIGMSFLSVIGYAIRGYDAIKWNRER